MKMPGDGREVWRRTRKQQAVLCACNAIDCLELQDFITRPSHSITAHTTAPHIPRKKPWDEECIRGDTTIRGAVAREEDEKHCGKNGQGTSSSNTRQQTIAVRNNLPSLLVVPLYYHNDPEEERQH
jgi:hypothetical protein